MNITHLSPNFIDGRGTITDLLDMAVDSVTLITTRAGMERGHHYHKQSLEYIYVLHGRLNAFAKRIDGTAVVSQIIEAGDLLVNELMEAHVIVALEDSVFLSMTRGPKQRGDTFPMRVA